MISFFKKFNFSFFSLIFLLSSFALAEVAPQLFMESGELLDLMHEMQTGKEIPQSWKNELKTRTKEFQLAWDQNSQDLIQESETISGRRFSRKEYSVALVLGPYLPMARPFLMNMSPYLQAANPTSAAATVISFVALTHHELLHHLLDNTEGKDFRNFSKLIQKYESKEKSSDGFIVSNENVLAHIHLMALQRAVYEKFGRNDLLDETNTTYLEKIGGAYAQAWKIVLREGVKPFLAELQEFNKQ